MSLRILFADDSVTAQNMGKKILTEAGYEVVAVSNGAAAVKKIAEQKPDIIILDVYMPGYSGLEVCEKVRSSIATIKTPVLLTVGKMEPYKAEDANRVRADGVIIKPFEASDLLAIIKKFEERIAEMPAAPVAAVAAPAPATVVEEMKISAPETNHEPPPRVVQPMVEVPDHMASSSAFSDLLGTDATRTENFYAPPAAETAPPVQSAPAAAAATEYELPASWRQEAQPEPTVMETQASAAPAASAPAARPIQIPVYQEPGHFEVVPTASAPTGDIEIPREAGLQETAEEATRNTVADLRDPDLMPTTQHFAPAQTARSAASFAQMPSAMGEASAPPQPVQHAGMAAVEPQQVVTELRPTAPSLSDADFEARVAAALAAYGQATESSETGVVANEQAAFGSANAAEETQELTALPDFEPANPASIMEVPVQQAPELRQEDEEVSAVAMSPETVSAAQPESAYVREPEPEMISAASINAEEPVVNHDAVVARVEAELPAAAEAVVQEAASGETEHDTIAQAVHRVMERMKENLVEEIVRELKTKR